MRKIVIPSSAFSLRTSAQTLSRLAGSSPVVGSSRKRISGLCTRAAARSSLPLHAPRVGADQAVDRSADVHQIEHLIEPCADLGGPEPVEPALESKKLAAGLPIVERGILERHADPQPDLLRVLHDVVTGHRGAARGRVQERAEHPDERGLARPVRAEEAVDLAFGHLKVDPVDCGDRAVPPAPDPVSTAGAPQEKEAATGSAVEAVPAVSCTFQILTSI